MDDLKKKTIFSLLWKASEKMIGQIITLIVSIILARMLEPSDYGTVALTTIFLTIGLVFVEEGIGTALIQQRHVKDTDLHTMMCCNFLMGIFLTVIFFLSAPIIAHFYENEQLIPIIRVLSIEFIFGSISSIIVAMLSRELKFKIISVTSICSAIISGIVGIVCAFYNAGAWALVAQQLSLRVIYCILLIFMSKYKFRMKFSWSRASIFILYGKNILLSRLLITFYTQIRSLIIGKIYSSEMLAFYNKGEQFPAIMSTSIDYSLQKVMLPVYSKSQDNINQLKLMVRKSMMMSSFVIFPIMMGLFATADNIIVILLTDKWLPCVPFMRILCLSYMLTPISTANLQAINALGRSDLTLKLEVITRIIATILIIITSFISVYALAFSTFIVSVINIIIRIWPNYKLLHYSYKEQIKDIMPSMCCSLFMGGIVLCFNVLKINKILLVFLQVLMGILIYLGLAKIFKVESLDYLLKMIKGIKNRRKNG